jgi:hypothetical protein
MRRYLLSVTIALSAAFGLASFTLNAQTPTPAPNPVVGTFWGVARSCNGSTRFPPPSGTVNQSICREACGAGGCQQSTFPIDEVAMMPEAFADGNFVATDHASLVDGHTIGQGRWQQGPQRIVDGKVYNTVQAAFMWFQPAQPQNVNPQNPWSRFAGMAHPRFVMYLDPTNPDVVIGYLQPFLFSMTDAFGIVKLQPGTPFASPDPTSQLPAGCDPTRTRTRTVSARSCS